MTHISSQPDTHETDVHTRDFMITSALSPGSCNKMSTLLSFNIIRKCTEALINFSASKVIANTELDTAYICSSHCLTNYMCAEKISVPYDSVACTTTFSSSKLEYLFCQTFSHHCGSFRSALLYSLKAFVYAQLS